ncbi:polysaccharide biosynthesis tyrosine autokinase [Halotia wernerae UHCC 0503]|nr:polysaccharide biosynthesis tyrosine autokinase [Halotia wernerae UHCC 0503]
MENYSSQLSSTNHNGNSAPSFFQTQPVPLFTQSEENESSFQDFFRILRRRALIIVGVATVAMTSVVISLTLKQSQSEYQGNFQMLVEPLTDNTKAVEFINEQYGIGQSGLDYESQIQVLKSPEMMKDIIKDLQTSYPDISYDSLLRSLTITQLDKTKIIEVTYRARNPTKIKFVLDEIANQFLKYSQQKRQTKLRQGIQFVETELPKTQNRVDQLLKQLQLFQQKYEFNDPESQAAEIASLAAALYEQRRTLDLQLAENRANFAILQGENGKLATLSNSPLYQDLMTQLRQLDVQIATESVRFQENNPIIQTLKEKRASLLPLLRQESQRVLDTKLAEFKTQLQNLESQSQELTQAEKRLENKRNQWPNLTRQYTQLKGQLQIALESLNRLLSTRELLQIEISQRELGWELLQIPNKPDQPVFPLDFTRNLIQGLVIGILLGIGAAMLIEKLDSTYHSVEDIKNKLKVPLLASLPLDQEFQSNQERTFSQNNLLFKVQNLLFKGFSQLNISPKKDYKGYLTNFSESLRVLHTNIQMLSSDRPIRSIIITSSMPSEGKSTIAFHLAEIAAAMGQRVLLVDADLRQPVVHTRSDLNNLWGLSNLISANLPMAKVIQQLPSMSRLSVITAGPTPPDPTKLLSSEKMKRLMTDFHNNYDLVIYDAPPVLGLADASVLAPNTDGLLMVVRLDKTESSLVKRALDNLKTSRLNVLGIVSNGEKGTYSYYRSSLAKTAIHPTSHP